MVNEIDPAKGHIFLVRGPVNSALYDLKKREIYSVNPLVASALGDGAEGVQSMPLAGLQVDSFRSLQASKPSSISGEALQVLRSYLAIHPALGQYAVTGGKGFREGGGSSPFSYQKVIGEYCNTSLRRLNCIWLELTQSCNLSCAHCYAEAGMSRPKELSLGQWKEILEEGAQLGAKEVQLTGGEPTLCPWLTELVEHAKSCQYREIEVFTNATRLEEGLLRKLATLGVKVALSIYSYDPETHDGITRSPGSFGRTVEGIKSLLDYQIPVRANVTLMKENLSHFKDAREFLKGLGLKEIGYDYVRPTGRGRAESTRLDVDVAKKAPVLYMPSSPEGIRGFCEDKSAWITCWRGEILIASDGAAYPCIFTRKMPVGKFPEMRLEEIIQGQAVQRLWQITLDEVETCKDCELRYGCFNCSALALTTTGKLLAKNPHCQYNPYTGLMEGHGEKGMKERPKTRIDLINETVEDEVVIYDPKNHNVHHLNPMAGIIWELLDGNHTPKEIAEEVISVLETDPVQVERDVTKTIEEFQRKGLLEEA